MEVSRKQGPFFPLIVSAADGSHALFLLVLSVPKASKATALKAEKSPAVPFLPYPESVKGYIGEDVAFDPLRISDYVPMDYLRESELK